MLTIMGNNTGTMVEAAHILIQNANHITGSTNLCITPVTMPFDPDRYGVGATVRVFRYPYNNMKEARQLEETPSHVEHYTIANSAYETNGVASKETFTATRDPDNMTTTHKAHIL